MNEWKTFFHTPFALLLVPSYVALCGVAFYSSLYTYYQMAYPSDTSTGVQGLNVTVHLLIPFLGGLFKVLVLIVPLLTMRTFAEERRSGTFELMVTYPVKPHEIILGKYFGVLTIILGMLSLSFVYPAFVFLRGEPVIPQILNIYLGYILFIVFYVSVGVYASLLTENQLIAAIITFGILLSSHVFSWIAFVSPSPFDRIAANFMVAAHMSSFQNGLLYLGDIVCYISLAVFFLLLSYWRLRRYFVR